MVWGWRVGAQLRRQGYDVLVLERGYLADRFEYTSIAWNGLNGRGDFPACPDDGGARFRSLGLRLQPLSSEGEYVLLIGQVPGDAALQGKDLMPWYEQQVSMHSEPVLFRPHPAAVSRGAWRPVKGAETSHGPLERALGGASKVITFNSNTGVDAMLAGKPVSCADEGSMIWGVDLADREQWASSLAWKQWTVAEIASGDALVGVVDRIRHG